mmetsp:Transcript_2970/g.10420  ORF Transcript_2970/g.10420 Transcript_2970/m.10420 type:complete len:329 (-) Transcript_2970:44-1030(-)
MSSKKENRSPASPMHGVAVAEQLPRPDISPAMASKLVQHSEGAIWVKSDVVSFFGATIETRMVVIRLQDGSLFVHSPTWLDEDVKTELAALGTVKYVVSPNKIHNQCMAQWGEEFPDCRLYASPGLVERRPDVKFYATLGDEPEPEWADEIDQAIVYGNSFFQEVLFFHKATGVLIVCDLIEYVTEDTLDRCGITGAKRWAVTAMMNAFYHGLCTGKPMPSPEFQIYTTDVDALKASIRKILPEKELTEKFAMKSKGKLVRPASGSPDSGSEVRHRGWEPQRILLCHGELIDHDALTNLSKVFVELLNIASNRGSLKKKFYDWIGKYQ